MRLLIIFTGGTIGSSVKDGYICADPDNMAGLLEMALDCNAGETDGLDIEVVNPYTILSETLDGTHIAALVKCINENVSACDGIIVCHGTDTLQYTAAALGFAFEDSDVPIVLVSSNYVLDDPRANGLENLKTAVEFITGRSKVPGFANRMRRGGVWVSYKNEGEERATLYEPFGLLPHQAYDDRLYVLKQMEQGRAAVTEGYDCRRMNEACLNLGKRSGILWIKAYPGMSYSGYVDCIKSVDYNGKKPECILLDSFHSGTINTSNEELFSLANIASENDISVYLIGLGTGVSYETTRLYAELGISVLPEMSPVTAYMWLWLSNCHHT
jgi:L-asparaginase